MRVLRFRDYDDLAGFMLDMADTEKKVVYAVLFYDEARELLKSLMMLEDTIPGNIELSEPICKGYTEEFYVVLDSDLEIHIEEAYHENDKVHNEGYYLFGDNDVIALYDMDVNDRAIYAGEGSCRFKIKVDEEPDCGFDINDEDFNDFIEYLYNALLDEE